MGLSICYVVPGHNLVKTAGPTRNVLSLARALSRHADMSVAFRRAPEPAATEPFSVLEIQPTAPGVTTPDDAALRGVGFGEFAAYLAALRRLVLDRLSAFDVVLEKGWLLSGFLSRHCRRVGIPAVPVENFIPVPGMGARQGPAAYARHEVARWLAGRFLRSAPLVVAETDQLTRANVARWGILAHRIRVIGMGVDRELFRPADQLEARWRLAFPADASVLLYVGALDRTHDLGPLLDAFRVAAPRGVELHIVGDGVLREQYERLALGSAAVRFHGRVAHEHVPTYIAAADLCVAPYSPPAFPGGEVGYSTLKIREYLSAGRAVASVPSGGITRLVRDGVSGLLVENVAARWERCLRELPSREQLGMMGRAAARTPLESWDDVALAYRSALEELVANRRSRNAA